MLDLGNRVLRGYEVQERIGAGGFGAVYRALQPVLGREVAIKVILPEFANDADFIRRFEIEAQLVARLEHPHIVPLFDYWREADSAYIVMRFLRGGSLRQILNDGGLPIPRALQITQQIASALAFSHRNGVIHRDVKPQNIMMDDDGNAYLSDFGIALLDKNKGEGGSENFVGSVAYAAPEALRTEGFIAPTDIYALGIVVYEMFSGMYPYGETATGSLVMKQLNDPLPPLPKNLGLPSAVDEVIARATAKDIRERYDDPLELARDLERAIVGKTVEVAPILPELVNPYKGLRAFTEADARDFFGREALVFEVLNRLTETDDYVEFLALVSPSGSGKTSFIHAGVIPAIRQGAITGADKWFIVDFTPNANPLEQLANALLSVASKPVPNLLERLRHDTKALVDVNKHLFDVPNSQLLIVIDSFEQIYTLTQDEAEREQFLMLLCETAWAEDVPVRVVVAMRADYYDRPLAHPEFSKLIQRRTQIVPPMTLAEVERAIVGPAERVGLTVERDFVNALIDDLRGQSGALPLMQYTLFESFKFREGRKLTLNAYHQTGGIFGALAKRPEELYQAIVTQSPAKADLVRQIFLRLVSLNADGSITRRKTARALLLELGDKADVNAILDEFGARFLLTFESEAGTREPMVTIAHEALMSQWQRLRGWIETFRDDLKTERTLAQATAEWQDHAQDKSYLLTGARLSQLEAWAQSTTLTLTPQERQFLQTSVDQREASRQAEQARQARELELANQVAREQRKNAQRLRVFAVFMLLVALGAVVLAVVARNAQMVAEAQRQLAQRRADEVQTLVTAFNAQLELEAGNADVAFALALEAAKLDNPPPAVVSVLMQTVYSLGTKAKYEGHSAPVMTAQLSPDGAYLLTGSGRYSISQRLDDDNTLKLWRVADQALLRTFEGHTDTVWQAVFTPDGAQVVSVSADETVRLWDVATGQEVRRFEGHTADVRTVDISPDGTRLLTGGGRFTAKDMPSDADLRLWDVATGQEVCRMVAGNSEVRRVRFLPDGVRALAVYGSELSSEGDNVMLLWDLQTCVQALGFEGHTDVVQDLALTSDGRVAYTASADRSVKAWDVETGELLGSLEGHTDWVNTVAVSADGHYVVSGGWDNAILLWDTRTKRVVHQFIGHSAPVRDLTFAADGSSFFSVAQDETVRQWNLQSSLLVRRYGLAGETASSSSATFSEDGTRLYTTSANGVIYAWDVATGAKLGTFEGAHLPNVYLYEMEVTRDGDTLFSSGSDGLVVVWDVPTRTARHILRGHEGRAWRITLSDDERLLASGSDDGTVRLWDVATGELLHTFEGDLSEVYTVSFGMKGDVLIGGTLDREIVVWDVKTYQELYRRREHVGPLWVSSVSEDGRLLATGGYDNVILVWDLASGDLLHRLQGHTKTIAGLKFIDDDTRLVSGAFDGTLRLWDTASGQELGRVNTNVAMTAFDVSRKTAMVAVVAEDDLVALNRLPLLDVQGLVAYGLSQRWLYPLSCEDRERFSLSLCETAP
jgi:WD40 repeat protein/serine/threonine protein kinase